MDLVLELLGSSWIYGSEGCYWGKHVVKMVGDWLGKNSRMQTDKKEAEHAEETEYRDGVEEAESGITNDLEYWLPNMGTVGGAQKGEDWRWIWR